MTKGLDNLPLGARIYLLIHVLLILLSLAFSLWVALLAYITGAGENLKRTPTELPEDLRKIAERARLLRLSVGAHSHLMGHVLMLFAVAVPYVFTKDKEKVKGIITAICGLSLLVYSLGRFFMWSYVMAGAMSVYSPLVVYMCYRILRELRISPN